MLAVNPLLIVPELKVNKRFINWLQHQYRWPHLKGIELPTFDWREVGIFIGANVPEALRQLDLRESSDGGLDGVKTPFVWTVQGNIPLEVCLSTTVSCNNIFNLEDDDVLKQFWLQELCGSVEDRKRTLTTQDEIALATLANTIRKVGTATKPHCEIGLPFKTPVIQLPNNRSDALKLLYARESRFRTDPAYAEKYTKAIEMYMEKGFARRLAMSELKGPVGKTWYVPHALVENPNKPDKPRLIFDARRKFNNRCLNDAFHNGPLLMTDMMDVLFFFRQKPHAVSMDITKMFLQVRIKSEDQTVFRFFWRRPGDPGPPIAYQMMVLIFGASLSPTCAAYVLRHIVKDHPEYADVAELVVKKFYVDNYLDSFETVEEGIETCRRLRELLFLGGFVLGQLATSTREILQSVPASDRANPDLNVDLDDLPIHRTLGLEWSGEDDSFFFTYCAPKATTKRQLLSAVSAIYDPLGFLAAVTITARVLLQDVWRVGRDIEPSGNHPKRLGWDHKLPPTLQERWDYFPRNIGALKGLRIPRCLRPISWPAKDTAIQLHLFCDASPYAIEANLFLRSEHQGKVQLRLITARARVAPVEQQTLTRLELMAALLGARLLKRYRPLLQPPIHSNYWCWCDSDNVLYWLRSQATLYAPSSVAVRSKYWPCAPRPDGVMFRPN